MITFRQMWDRQAAWSERAFGKERGPLGPLKHLLLELDEIDAAAPDARVLEWADALILACDATRRAGGAAPSARVPGDVDRFRLRAAVDKLIADDAPAGRLYDLIDDIFACAAADGVCADDLIAAAYVKTLINERRVWLRAVEGEPAERVR